MFFFLVCLFFKLKLLKYWCLLIIVYVFAAPKSIKKIIDLQLCIRMSYLLFKAMCVSRALFQCCCYMHIKEFKFNQISTFIQIECTELFYLIYPKTDTRD